MKSFLSYAWAIFHVASFTSVLLQVRADDPFSWDLDLNIPGYLMDPPISDGVLNFFTSYNASFEGEYTIQVFETDCSTPSDGLVLVTDTLVDDTLDTTFLYNQSVIQASNLWTANSTGGDVDFCIKVSLFSNATLDSILFNFIETIYKIQIDLTSGFSTAVDLVRTEAGDGGTEAIDLDESITVYQCDDSYNEITSPPPLTQGDSLVICVETETDSVFEVGKIKDVSIAQNGTKNFDYVTNYVESYWADSTCISVNTTAAKCKVQMQLLGVYFSDEEPSDLTVTGFVKMDYLGRRMLKTVDKRNLQVEQGTGFSMAVPVGSMEDGNGVDEGPEESPDMNSMESAANAMLHGSIFVMMMMIAMSMMMN